MTKRLVDRLSYANVVSTLCLFLILGMGGAYAAKELAKNSVGSKQIKDGAVKGVDVKDNSLNGTDIDEPSLGKVPSATNADSATSATNADKLDNKDSADFQLKGSDPYTPASLNSSPVPINCYWTNATFAPEFSDAAYYRDRDGLVHLKGFVQAKDGPVNACGTQPEDRVIQTLPPGYRPAERSLFISHVSGKFGRVDVLPTGDVTFEGTVDSGTWADAKDWVTLDGITFRCEPSGSNGCP